jgi:glycosyltransferase involved in cell wall biosynthesis
VAKTTRDPAHGAAPAKNVQVAAALAFDLRAPGGGALMTPPANRLLLVIVPAYNEEAAVGNVVRAVLMAMPGTPVLVIDDCSLDSTQHVARQAGADVLPLPHHLGLGGCVQAGYKLAFELGYQYVIRVDGDGQHDPRDIPRLFDALRHSGCEMVIGSRFVSENGSRTGTVRSLGIRFFRMMLRPILGRPVHDPTSGFVGVNRDALQVFSKSFPLEYPEIEALVVLQRKRFRFQEVPCKMHPRTTGRSSITALKSIYYIIHVLLGVFVNVLKFEKRGRRPPPPAKS